MSNKEDGVPFTGTVVDVSNSVIFVEVVHGENKNKFIITAYPSGKLRENSIHILLGDLVDVECSPYDFGKGRVVYRHARR
jgi:translation initiation factor IF-1